MLRADTIMLVVFSLISIAIIAVIISHLYDFMQNKDDVNSSLDLSASKIEDIGVSSKRLKEDSKVIQDNVEIIDGNTRVSQERIDELYDKYRKINQNFLKLSRELGDAQNVSKDFRMQQNNAMYYVENDISDLRSKVKNITNNFNREDNHGEIMKIMEDLNEKIGGLIQQHGSIVKDIQSLRVTSSFKSTALELDEMHSDISRDLKMISQKIVGTDAGDFDMNALQEMLSDIIHKNHAIMKMLLMIDVKIRRNEVKFSNLEGSMNNYFKFNDSVESPSKIFDRVAGGIQPELNFVAHTKHDMGLTVTTPDGLTDDRNLRICNNKNSCINLNANGDGFNITPEDINNLTINDKNKLPMAKFDMQDRSVYIGGADMNAPLFIKDNNLYVNNINMIMKEPGTKITAQNMQDIPTLRLTGEDANYMMHMSRDVISDVMNKVQVAQQDYENNKEDIMSIFKYGKQLLMDKAETINDSTIHYTLKNDYDASTKKLVSKFVLKIFQTRRMKKGDMLAVLINLHDIFGENAPPNNISAKDNTVKNIMVDANNMKMDEEIFNPNNPNLIVKQSIAFLARVNKEMTDRTPFGFMPIYLEVVFTFPEVTLQGMDNAVKSGTCKGRWVSKDMMKYTVM